MGIISRIFYFFAPYTDTRERSVGLFFKGLTEHSDRTKTRRRLSELLQRDIAVINLWTEYRYKGYRYLRKRERRKLYANLRLITDDFVKFHAENSRPSGEVTARISSTAPRRGFRTTKRCSCKRSWIILRRGAFTSTANQARSADCCATRRAKS